MIVRVRGAPGARSGDSESKNVFAPPHDGPGVRPAAVPFRRLRSKRAVNAI